MQKEINIQITDSKRFKQQLLSVSQNLENFAFLDNNESENNDFSYNDFDFLAAISINKEILSLDNLEEIVNYEHGWLIGFLTYDLKNEVENLSSNNIDFLQFPTLHFYKPETIILSRNSLISVIYDDQTVTKNDVLKLIDLMKNTNPENFSTTTKKVKFNQRFTKTEYINTVKKIKEHIQRGDIYEANFCQEFYSRSEINPIKTYLKLNEVSPTPFSCFYKIGNKYLISASPERFLKKVGSKVISQPIKGTIKRGKNELEDQKLKNQLYNDPKERAENVMIVDLVRNDLSRTAKKGSVKVEELYGIYSFKQVHQMISTVVSEVEENTNIVEIIKNAFPMGSMTGAPKIRAMELIEKYERTKRGLFSGSVGYITPENNFDFNVVIRSILYNQSKNYVSFTVGGAITSLSGPEKEFEECMVKAEAMLKALS